MGEGKPRRSRTNTQTSFPGKEKNSRSASRNSSNNQSKRPSKNKEINQTSSGNATSAEDAKNRASLLKLKKTQDKYDQILEEKQIEVNELKAKAKSISQEKDREFKKIRRDWVAEKEKLNEQLTSLNAKFEQEIERNKNNLSPAAVKKLEEELQTQHNLILLEKTKDLENTVEDIRKRQSSMNLLIYELEEAKIDNLSEQFVFQSIVESFDWNEKRLESIKLGKEIKHFADAGTDNTVNFKLVNLPEHDLELNYEIRPKSVLSKNMSAISMQSTKSTDSKKSESKKKQNLEK